MSVILYILDPLGKASNMMKNMNEKTQNKRSVLIVVSLALLWTLLLGIAVYAADNQSKTTTIAGATFLLETSMTNGTAVITETESGFSVTATGYTSSCSSKTDDVAITLKNQTMSGDSIHPVTFNWVAKQGNTVVDFGSATLSTADDVVQIEGVKSGKGSGDSTVTVITITDVV